MADPNWLLGVGLQRGWNSAFDACFYADNLYNNTSFNGRPPSVDEPITSPIEWSEHKDNLTNLMTKLGNNSRDNKLSEEMNSGMLDEKGPVVLQLDKFLKTREVDAPVPQYLPIIEPWYRYHEYKNAIRKNYKGQLLFNNIHPTTTRELAIFKKNNRFVEKGMYMRNTVTRPTAAMLTWMKRFECSAFWCDMSMRLLEIDGKAAPGEPAISNRAGQEEKKDDLREEIPASQERPKMDSAIAKQKSDSLRDNIMSPRPSGIRKSGRKGVDGLLSHASKKSQYQKLSVPLLSDEEKASVAPPVAANAAHPFEPNSLLVIQNVTKTLDDSADVSTKGIVHELRIKAISWEREVCEARLKVAQTEVVKAEAEEAVLRAKKASAQKQVEAMNNLLEAYQDAESRLLSIAAK